MSERMSMSEQSSPRADKAVTISESGVRINHKQTSGTERIAGHGYSSHSYSRDETTAFTTFIVNVLSEDPLLARHFPIDPNSEDIFTKLDDGLILTKLINYGYPGTIDEARINKGLTLSIYQKQENLNMVLAGAKSIGCQLVNIGGQDIIAGRPTLILGLLWQIIKLQLLAKVTVTDHPEMDMLRGENESEDAFSKLPAEQILLRWMNFHLARAGETPKRNFDNDMKDPIVFCKLISQLDRHIKLPADIESQTDDEKASFAIDGARFIGAETFHQPHDLCTANSKLNMVFAAQLFNVHPGLDEPEETEEERLARIAAELEEQKRKEEEEARRLAEEEARNYAVIDLDEDGEPSSGSGKVKIIRDVYNNKEELENLRRFFHMHPELSFQENGTAAKIAEVLRSYGIEEIYEGVGKTGVVCVIRGGAGEGPCIGLRADMDALPIQESGDLPWKSTNDGVMHACGHDGHMAGLLTAVKVLQDTREKFAGSFKIIFQPAEEGYGGAQAMIQDGVLDDGAVGPNVDAIYGLHLWTPEPLGHVCVSDGPVMAASDKFEIKVRGKGGHGGAPQGTVDAIVEAATLVTNLQSIVSRNLDPLDAGVITCGTINGGFGYNVIPDLVTITGTTRSMTSKTQTIIKTRMCEMCKATETMFGGEVELDYKHGYPVTNNGYPECVAIVKNAATKIVGEEKSGKPMKSMGAEDFSYFLEQRPGCFFFVGAQLPGDAKPHHKSNFDFDERAMMIGASVFVQIAKDLMEVHSEQPN